MPSGFYHLKPDSIILSQARDGGNAQRNGVHSVTLASAESARRPLRSGNASVSHEQVWRGKLNEVVPRCSLISLGNKGVAP